MQAVLREVIQIADHFLDAFGLKRDQRPDHGDGKDDFTILFADGMLKLRRCETLQFGRNARIRPLLDQTKKVGPALAEQQTRCGKKTVQMPAHHAKYFIAGFQNQNAY